MFFQLCSSQGTMSETIMARSGQLRLTRLISSRLVCSGRSVMSSMLFSPITCRSCDISVE